jgi:signal peptidase I
MLPTFNNRGDVVIFERVHSTVTPLCSELKFMSEPQISARNGYIARGDVVVSRSPTNPVQLVCKRVVALVRLRSLHS